VRFKTIGHLLVFGDESRTSEAGCCSSRNVVPFGRFHSINPFALRPCTTAAANEGLLNSTSLVSVNPSMLPSVASAARLRLTYSGVDGTSDAATLEPFRTTKPSLVCTPRAFALLAHKTAPRGLFAPLAA
jgi:hypothetical protein